VNLEGSRGFAFWTSLYGATAYISWRVYVILPTGVRLLWGTSPGDRVGFALTAPLILCVVGFFAFLFIVFFIEGWIGLYQDYRDGRRAKLEAKAKSDQLPFDEV
jgi:hypothetical protein